MKRQLLFSALLIISTGAFAQAKTDTTKKKDAPPAAPQIPAPQEKRFFAVLSEQEWGYLFSIIRTSGKLSANDANNYVDALNGALKEIPSAAPAPDTAQKKK